MDISLQVFPWYTNTNLMGYLGLDAVMKVAPTVLIDYGLWISIGVEVNGVDGGCEVFRETVK